MDIQGYPMSKIILLEPADEIQLIIRNKKEVVFKDTDIKGFLERTAISVGNSAKINVPIQHLGKLPAKVYVVICK